MRDYDDYKLDSGQEDKVFSECDYCGGPIYVGEEYLKLQNGDYLHTDCFERYVEQLCNPKLKVAGEK